jgi:hypothetical protein
MADSHKLLKSHERVRLPFMQRLNHYFIVILLLVTPVITLIDIVLERWTKTRKHILPATEMIDTSLAFLILAVIAFLIQRDRLRFREVEIEYTDDEFREAIQRTKNEIGWRIRTNNKNLLRAERHFPWGGWGELITIKKAKNKLFLNSICDPYAKSSVVSFGWNTNNIKIFLKNLDFAIRKEPYTEISPRVIKEWSLKNTLIRILLYVICVLLILVGFFAIVFGVDLKTFILSVIVISFGCFYIYLDVKVLIEKRRAKENVFSSKAG